MVLIAWTLSLTAGCLGVQDKVNAKIWKAKMKHSVKRTIVIVAATAVVIGLPTFAAAKHRHHPRHYIPYGEVYGGAPAPCYPYPACTSPYAVFSAGTYVGSDPDPRIRAQLLSDFNRGVNSMRR
jgi:hypothetical protein